MNRCPGRPERVVTITPLLCRTHWPRMKVFVPEVHHQRCYTQYQRTIRTLPSGLPCVNIIDPTGNISSSTTLQSSTPLLESITLQSQPGNVPLYHHLTQPTMGLLRGLSCDLNSTKGVSVDVQRPSSPENQSFAVDTRVLPARTHSADVIHYRTSSTLSWRNTP